MGSSLDALNAPSSLTQRRQATHQFPPLELPAPPTFSALQSHRYLPLSGPPQQPNTGAVSVNNLLTPPSNSASDSGATSAGIPTGATPNGISGLPLPYTPTFFNQSITPGYHTGLTPQYLPISQPQRTMFSPQSQSVFRPHSNSPTVGEASSLPPPPYELHSTHAYGMPMSLASPPGSSLASQPPMPQSSGPMRPPSQQSSHTRPEIVPSLSSSAPSMYATGLPPVGGHQSAYPYAGSTPVSQSPHSAGGQAPHHSPPMNPYPASTFPAWRGPVMSNVGNPGSQMSMVGSASNLLPPSFNSGYAANPHSHMYGNSRTQSPAQNPQNDRPFRCDSCPQSFHRNHDLKRHKRIHLAVKPFPCPCCDKSFSRKDALKVCLFVIPGIRIPANLFLAPQTCQGVRESGEERGRHQV
jgi:hypothetical protein